MNAIKLILLIFSVRLLSIFVNLPFLLPWTLTFLCNKQPAMQAMLVQLDNQQRSCQTFCLLVKHSSESECEQDCQVQFGPGRFKFNSRNLSSSHITSFENTQSPLKLQIQGSQILEITAKTSMMIFFNLVGFSLVTFV